MGKRIPDLSKKCQEKGCKRPYDRVSRFGHALLCEFHRQTLVANVKRIEEQAAKAREQRQKIVDSEAHDVAEDACGFVQPPKVKPYTNVSHVSGGLPSLGKNQ